MFTRKEVAAEIYIFFVFFNNFNRCHHGFVYIPISVMIVCFITFALFSSTPAPEDGSWSRFGYGGSRGRGSRHGWWGNWWQTLKLPALGDVKIAEIECHELLRQKQKQPSILFGLIAFANLWSFFKMVAPCFRFFAHASWVKFPDLAKCEKDMAAAPVAPMTSSKKKNSCRISNYILKIKGGWLVRFLHFPCSSRALWYILLITCSWNLLTCNLDHLPHFTQMEAPGKFSERSDIPQHYVTTFPTSVDEVERFTGAFP